MAQVSPDGTVCFFANTDIDLVVDVVGYVSAGATNKFTPSTPFRFTDTRDVSRTRGQRRSERQSPRTPARPWSCRSPESAECRLTPGRSPPT